MVTCALGLSVVCDVCMSMFPCDVRECGGHGPRLHQKCGVWVRGATTLELFRELSVRSLRFGLKKVRQSECGW